MKPDEVGQALAKLPPKEREQMEEHLEELHQNSKKVAMAAIMIRNFSHGVGRHAINCEQLRKPQ